MKVEFIINIGFGIPHCQVTDNVWDAFRKFNIILNLPKSAKIEIRAQFLMNYDQRKLFISHGYDSLM